MSQVTAGQGELGRIYDRLRKRALRKLARLVDGTEDSYAALIADVAHKAYLRGLKDALKEADKVGTECTSCGWECTYDGESFKGR